MPSLVKELMMKEVVGKFAGSPYPFMSNFEGLTVSELSDYRRAVEKTMARSVVMKHSIVKRVFADQSLPSVDLLLKGSLLVTFAERDPQFVSKAIVEFSKSHNKLVPAGVLFERQLYDQEFVKRLAKLPSRHELLTQVVTRVKSPITGFVMTLGQIVRGLVVVLNEVKNKKEAQPA